MEVKQAPERAVKLGSKWVAAHAYGRLDAISFTVRGVTEHGICITSPEGRSPNHLYSQENFLKLYRPDTR